MKNIFLTDLQFLWLGTSSLPIDHTFGWRHSRVMDGSKSCSMLVTLRLVSLLCLMFWRPSSMRVRLVVLVV